MSFLFSWCWGPLHRGSRGPPRSGVAFPTTSRLQQSGTLLATALARRTQLNYIIARRPLDIWNRMFNRHQAEITVMKFRGHSLPVHHSVVYHGNFSCSSRFISQFPPTWFPLITAIRMYHFLPVHHLGMAFLAGAKGQNITPRQKSAKHSWSSRQADSTDFFHYPSPSLLTGPRSW